jgi:hypothetical protein
LFCSTSWLIELSRSWPSRNARCRSSICCGAAPARP